MRSTGRTVRERQAMLAGMTPVLNEGVYFFCSTTDASVADAALVDSLAMFREDEGVTLVLNEADALKHGFEPSTPMRRIVLRVFSSLEGVGLTAAVATALAEQQIPCNVIAAHHHDNVFVPASMGPRAVSVLKEVQRAAAAG